MFRNRNPPRAANVQIAIVLAPENGALRKKRISISGSRRRSSYSTSATKHTSENANSARMPAEVQPARGSLDDRVGQRGQRERSPAPARPGRAGEGDRPATRGTNVAVSTSASAPIGTFTKNTARHPTESTSAPPTTGPSAMLSPNTAPHMPIACGALARIVEHVADDRHRHRVEHRPADRLEDAERDQQLEARCHPAQERAEREHHEAGLGTPACARSGRRWSRTASAGWPAPACRRRSPTASRRPRRRRSVADRRQARRSRSSCRARRSAG